MASKTRLTNFKKLQEKGELGVVLGRLMVAVNDIGIANDALGSWMKEQEGNRKERQRGAKMYFVRMLISHVFEALTIVTKINNTPELSDSVQRSYPDTRDQFARCVAVVGTAKYKLMKKLRSGSAFHYLDEPVRNAIVSQAKKVPDINLSLTVSDDHLEWYYEPGDRILDSAVVRGIFEIPETVTDVQREVDRIIHEIQEVGDHLVQFAGFFIMQHAP